MLKYHKFCIAENKVSFTIKKEEITNLIFDSIFCITKTCSFGEHDPVIKLPFKLQECLAYLVTDSSVKTLDTVLSDTLG